MTDSLFIPDRHNHELCGDPSVLDKPDDWIAPPPCLLKREESDGSITHFDPATMRKIHVVDGVVQLFKVTCVKPGCNNYVGESKFRNVHAYCPSCQR